MKSVMQAFKIGDPLVRLTVDISGKALIDKLLAKGMPV